MTIRILLLVSAALEAGIGIALLVSPSLPLALLLGVTLDGPGGAVVARVAGAGLLSLGLACALGSRDAHSGAARGLVTAMLVYNLVATAVLLHAAIGLQLSALGLWPAVGLHALMGLWCVACLRHHAGSSRTP